MQNDSHITVTKKMPSEPIKGPVPMKHRLRLGEDVLKNPQGVGMPSKKNEVGNARSAW